MHKHKKQFMKSVKGFAPFLTPYKWAFIGAMIMGVITIMTITLSPYFEGLITTQLANDVVHAKEHVIVIQFHVITQIMVILLGIYMVKTIAQMFAILWLTNAIQRAMQDMRNAVLRKIRALPVRYFDTHPYGDILSRVSNDVDAISNAMQQSLMNVFSGMLTVLFALVMMFFMNWIMALVAFFIIPLSLLITQGIVRLSQKRFKAQQDALGTLNGAITEMYTGYNEILLYNRQADSIEQFRKLNDDLCTHAFKAQFVSSIISPLNAFVTYTAIGIIAVLGTMNIMRGTLQVGNLQAFIRYIWQINDPLSQISALSSQIQTAVAALMRVLEILAEEEEASDYEAISFPQKTVDTITFDHVHFAYAQKPIINDINIHVSQGQMVAIVGPTGAGKTTLINLLLRFYDVNKGGIYINGINIKDMKRTSLREQFGMVLQDTWLFSGSIYDNIRYGRLDAEEEDIIRAAKMANVDHFIHTLLDGYHAMINEEANNISQGEKQLLTIARALLKDPQVLILDEATSSVDTRLETMIQDAMKKLMHGRTSFVIAHRLSTIRNADLILVIQEGDIVEQGTHDELMKKCGVYENLYNSQFSKKAIV